MSNMNSFTPLRSEDFNKLRRADSKIDNHIKSIEAKYAEKGKNRPTYWDGLIANFGDYLQENRRYDSNLVLQAYETAFDLDPRVVKQFVESSALRSTFANYPNEKAFDEFTGVDPNRQTYDCQIWDVSSLDNTNEDAQLGFAQGGNEIRTIRASTNIIRRPIKPSQMGFELYLKDLEIAASLNQPLQSTLTEMTANSLGISEQTFAFKSNYGTQPWEKGLLNNTAIPTTVSASVNWTTATDGFSIVKDINNVKSKILAIVKNAFSQTDPRGVVSGNNYLAENAGSLPFCLLVSLYNLQQLQQPYSTLDGSPILDQLTKRGIRVVGMPVMPDSYMYAYFKSPSVIELSTAMVLRSLPQSYEARKLVYFCPYENVSAGLTVKVPEGIYKVSGIGT